MEREITGQRTLPVLVVSPPLMATLVGYEAWLVARRLRPRAIETYLRELRQFFAFLGSDATIADVTLENIERFQVSCSHLAGATLGKLLTVIRSYCRYCIRKKLRADDPTLEIDWPQREETPPRALRLHDLQVLDQVMDVPIDTLAEWRHPTRLRDRIAVLLMLYAGLRIAEAAAQCWRDIDLDELMLTVRNAKGGKFRVIPIHRRIAEALREIPEAERRGAVCGRRTGKARSRKSLPHIFDRWLREAGLDISAHQLRHTFATRLLWNGANLREIQRLLGHESLATTERYLALEIEQKRKAIDTLPDRW